MKPTEKLSINITGSTCPSILVIQKEQPQMGPNAGEEIQFCVGDPKALTDPNTSVTKVPLRGTFDRPSAGLDR